MRGVWILSNPNDKFVVTIYKVTRIVSKVSMVLGFLSSRDASWIKTQPNYESISSEKNTHPYFRRIEDIFSCLCKLKNALLILM
jgi:hypothetical protein